MRTAFNLSILSFMIVCSTAVPSRAADVVARIGARTIVRQDIACSARAAAERRCAEVEQAKFENVARTHLMHAAMAYLNQTLTDDEVLKLAPKTLPADTVLQSFARRATELAGAALKVREGAATDEVFSELAPRGITRQQFDAALAAYPTADAARADLRRDALAVMRGQLIEQQRLRIYTGRIASAIAARAAQQRVRSDVASVQFWRAVLQDSKTQVYDKRFHLPRMEELFNDPQSK